MMIKLRKKIHTGRLMCIGKWHTEGESEILRQISGESKKVHINTCPQTFFELQPPRSPDLSPLDFYVWGHIQVLTYSFPTEQEQTLHQRIFNAC